MADETTGEDIKRRTAQRFDRVAGTYDENRAIRACAARFLELAQLQSGEKVLDIATGTGLISIPAARAIGPTSSVVGIDLAEEMLARARRKASSAALTNIKLKVGDAERLDFPDASFDVVLCGLAIFFLPNQQDALREWRRVLKPGGRVHFSAWGEGSNQPMTDLYRRRLESFGIQSQPPVGPLTLLEQCRVRLQEAGFIDIAVLSEQHGYYFSSLDDYWQEQRDGPAGAALSQLSPEQLGQFKKEHLSEVEALATEKGLWRNTPVNFAQGLKPR